MTIDPERDGPKDVGQYATMFGAPIIGLTGSPAQIDRVKKQFGIFAEPEQMGGHDYQMSHTSTVLLFGRERRVWGTVTPNEASKRALQDETARRLEPRSSSSLINLRGAWAR